QWPWAGPLMDDLERHRGRSIVIAGETQPHHVHAMVNLINERLGNVGKTVIYSEPAEANPVEQIDSLRELADDLEADRIDTLIMIGGNPVYTAPADLDFSRRLERVPLRVHQSLYYDQTST